MAKTKKKKNSPKKAIKKSKKQPILQQDSIRLILMGILLVLVLAFGSIKGIMKKKEIPPEETEFFEKSTEEFTFEIQKNTSKEILLNIKNNSSETKNYNLEISNITNELKNTKALSYKVYLNQEQKVFREIFPIDEMILVEEVEVEPSKELEIKFVLNYKDDQEDIGKVVSAKLDVRENENKDETIDK